MNKSELIDVVTAKAELSRSDATKAIEATIEHIKQELVRGGTVRIADFGKFQILRRAARAGRNPRTGKQIQIAASNRIRFRAGKALKDAVN